MAIHSSCWIAILPLLFSLLLAPCSASGLKVPMRYQIVQRGWFYAQMSKHLSGGTRDAFWGIVQRKDLNKAEIDKQLQKWAMSRKGSWIGIYRGLTRSQHAKHQSTLAGIRRSRRSQAAKNFLLKHTAITFNSKIDWIQDCRQKNELIRTQPQAVINELRLYFNSYCLDELESKELKRYYDGRSARRYPHRITDFYIVHNNYYQRYFIGYYLLTKGRQHQEVMRIIINPKLTIGQIKKQLLAWSRKNKQMSIWQRQIRFLTNLKKGKQASRPGHFGKISKEATQAKMRELAIHFDENQTLQQMCRRKNELFFRAGPKVTQQARFGLDSWCFGNFQYNIQEAQKAIKRPARTGTRIVTESRYKYIISRRPSDTYFVELINLVPPQTQTHIRQIILNQRLPQHQIRLQLEELAKKQGGEFQKVFIYLIQQENEQKKEEEERVKVRVPKLSDEAAQLIRLELKIRHDDRLSPLEQCKKKNDLLLEYGDEIANEAGLALNTWCLDSDGGDDSEYEEDDEAEDEPHSGHGKPRKPQKHHHKPRDDEHNSGGGRVINIDEEYTIYAPFLSRLPDEQLSEVEIIIKDNSLSKHEILRKLEHWSKEHSYEKIYKSLLVYIKEREQRSVEIEKTVKLSAEARKLLEAWKLISSDQRLTSIETCQRKNELLIKFGDKAAKELGYQPNSWCMNVKPPAPTPVLNECSCDIAVTIDNLGED